MTRPTQDTAAEPEPTRLALDGEILTIDNAYRLMMTRHPHMRAERCNGGWLVRERFPLWSGYGSTVELAWLDAARRKAAARSRAT